MDLKLTDDQKMMQETARRFARERIAPIVDEDEKAHRFRPEIVAEMGKMGFFGCLIDDKWGGTETGWLAAELMTMEIAQVSASWGLPFNMQMNGPAFTIQRWGNDEQKKRYIPGLVAGQLLGCFAMTEPNTGSDVASMKTVAKPTKGGFILNGQKTWISQAHLADVGLIYAYTEPEKKHRGMTCFLVDLKTTKGVTTRAIEQKFGLYCSPTGEIFFEDAFVPDNAVLGQVNDGFKICMSMLDGTRLSCAARAVAVGKACLEASLAYTKERKQFGQPISSFQLVQAELVKMHVDHEAAKLLVMKAAVTRDEGDLRNTAEISTAKLFAADAAVHAAEATMKLFGSYGYSLEYPAARFMRDAMSYQIVEGTSNVQKIVIARHLLENG